MNITVTTVPAVQEEKPLSDELIARIREWNKKQGNMEIYWDYRDRVTDEQIAAAIKESSADMKALWCLENEIQEQHSDEAYRLETERAKDIFDYFKDEIAAELGVEEEDIDADEAVDQILEQIIRGFEDVYVDYGVKSLLNNTPDICLRLELHSNYDCINSHHFETSAGGYEFPDSYFADVVKALQLNPDDVADMLRSMGVEAIGEWPFEDSQPLITMADFWKEEVNRCCPACLLVLPIKLSAYDYLDTKDPKTCTLRIPAGTLVGYHSWMEGGGSTFDAKLLRDIEIDLAATEVGWQLSLDCEGGYGIKDVYGHSDLFTEATVVAEPETEQ